MAILDNFISGVATAGGVQLARGLADGKSANIKNIAPFIGGGLVAYAIGRYQDMNGKMGSVAVAGITGGAAALASILLKKDDHFTTVKQTAGMIAAATGANYACERYLNFKGDAGSRRLSNMSSTFAGA